MNVKPGDIAKVISGLNIGAQVYVLDALPVDMNGERISMDTVARFERAFGKIWRIELLQSCWVFSFVSETDTRMPAGTKLHCPDAWLRRVDPPGDAKETFSEDPTKEEIASNYLNLSEGEPS